MASNECRSEALLPPVTDEQAPTEDIDQAMNLSETNNNVSKHHIVLTKPEGGRRSKKNDSSKSDSIKGERSQEEEEGSESVPSESKRSKRSNHVKNTDTTSSDTTPLDSDNGQSPKDDNREGNGQDSIDGTYGAGEESLSDRSEGQPAEGEQRTGQGHNDQEEGTTVIQGDTGKEEGTTVIQGDTGKENFTLNHLHNTIL